MRQCPPFDGPLQKVVLLEPGEGHEGGREVVARRAGTVGRADGGIHHEAVSPPDMALHDRYFTHRSRLLRRGVSETDPGSSGGPGPSAAWPPRGPAASVPGTRPARRLADPLRPLRMNPERLLPVEPERLLPTVELWPSKGLADP